MRPVFSVIIPTYDRPSVVLAVKSVLAQTEPDFEVLVIDDGSGPDAERLISEMAAGDSRIQVHRHDRPSGDPVRPRNTGLQHAQGQLIAFLDDDDTWMPEKLELQRAKFAEADYALVYGDAFVRSSSVSEMDGRLYSEAFDTRPVQGEVGEDLIGRNFVPTLTAVVRRDWMERIGAFGGRRVRGGVEDYHYWLRVALMGGRFGLVPRPMATYSWSDAGLTNSRAETREAVLADVYRDLEHRFPAWHSQLAGRERILRVRRNEQRFSALPDPVRALPSRLLLPPRLWRWR